MKKNIIIADDHPITAKGMETTLQNMGYNVIGSYTNGLQAFNHICLNVPEYALLDVQMPGLCGLDILEKIRAKNIKTKVIIYTMFNDLSLFKQATKFNVNGYLLKEFALDDLKACMKAIELGKNWYHPKLEEKLNLNQVTFSPELYSKLSSKERLIVKCIAEKKSTKEISEEQFIGEKTVETHRRNIKKKLNLDESKNALLIWAIENKGFFSLME